MTAGALPTVRVKAWVALTPIPLDAVKVIGNVPVSVGVPESTLPLKVTPVGSAPDSVTVGDGLPVVVTVNVLDDPSANEALFAEVMAEGALPLGPGIADHTNPLVSDPLEVKVTSVFQLSVTTPLVLAHTRPASHTPLVSDV